MGLMLSKQAEEQLDRRIREQREQAKNFLSETTKLRGEQTVLQEQISTLQGKIARENSNLSQTNTQLNQSQKKLSQLKANQMQIQRQIQSNNTQISKLSIKIMEIQKQLDDYQNLKPNSQSLQAFHKKPRQQKSSQKIEERRRHLQQVNKKCFEKQLQINSKQQNTSQLQIILQLKREIQDRDLKLTCLLSRKEQLQGQIILLNKNIVFIRLTLYNQEEISFAVLCRTTIRQLKDHIYTKHNDQLLPEQMVLLDNQHELADNQEIRHIFHGNRVKLGQRMAQIWELEGYQSYRNKYDEIFCQTGVIKIKCGHQYSREGMRSTILYQVNFLKQEKLSCQTISKEGFACKKNLEIKECQLVTGFTKDEWNVIQQKLSTNYGLRNVTICPIPGCKSAIQRKGIQFRKVSCPICHANCCIECGQPWLSEGNSVCMSQKCVTMRTMIANAPWTRVFNMHQRGDHDNTFPVKVPDLRACPKCKSLVQNKAYCKHTKCPCGQYFCFVCLSISDGEHWECGGGYEYCQRIAPNQTLNSLKSIQV